MKTHSALRQLRPAILGLALCVLPAQSRAQSLENLVENGEFTTTTDPWLLRLGKSSDGGEVFATLARTDAGEASVLIVNGGKTKAAVVLQQPLSTPLVKDGVYTVTFDARSDAPKSIDVVFRGADNGILGGTYNLPVGPSLARLTFTYTHVKVDAVGAKLAFRIGGNNTPVTLDNITVTRQTAPSSDPAASPAAPLSGASAQ